MIISNDDTIVAVATPSGDGAISIIRVSGDQSINFADKIFHGKIKLVESSSHRIHYGKVKDRHGEVIDDVLVSVFKNPKSFTGEDSVEISFHGSQLISKKIISSFLNLGVRLAEPGEFTKRAFLNGKIDLAQAEAVADVINSRTEASLRGARNQLDGLLSAKVNSLREALIHTSSLVELELDFAEEDLEFVPLDNIKNEVNKIVAEIRKLLETYTFGKVIKDGVNVALVGKPNVGKSSLLNYMVKESRAIVSEIPGTTRDIISEEISIDGVLIKIFDTAGIRPTNDPIEIEGVERSREAVKNSDIVIFINDATEGFANDLYLLLLELTSDDRIVNVSNKIDLVPNYDLEGSISISALTGKGINSLFDTIKKKAIGSQSYSEHTAIVSNLRHFQALEKAEEFLNNVEVSIDNQLTGEFISVDLRNAELALGEIIGKVTTDDILNNIFEKFCIGK